VNVPPRDILPKPVQKPHPPIWAAATSPATWELAGKNGIGILGLTIFVSVAQLADRVKAYKAALKDAKPVGKFVNDKVGAFTIVHVAETRDEAIANGGADAAINYLLYAFRVLGGFADPSGKGMQREYAELEIKSTPYRDLIAKEYPLIAKDAEGRVHVRGARRRGHGDRRRRRPRDPQGREVQGGGPRPPAVAHAGGSRAAPRRHEVDRALREARDAALPVSLSAALSGVRARRTGLVGHRARGPLHVVARGRAGADRAADRRRDAPALPADGPPHGAPRIHAAILCVGGHWTYAEVPFGFWMQRTFGFARNHYDRIGHFAQGFVPAIVAREVLIRRSPLAGSRWLPFVVISFCLAVSALYELIEWWAALATEGGPSRSSAPRAIPGTRSGTCSWRSSAPAPRSSCCRGPHDRALARARTGA
jgi:hypothetical protein